ncbi:MAG TPA: outer membrane protein assembly factor BamA [Candidatus Krumholzibacteria bacterium]|nr:outer membrane protein assembly factor BamA [Candidatus Krumholzibacteria bacterium]
MKLNTLGAVAGLVVAAFAAVALAAGRPTVFIQKITIKGNQKVSRSQIVRILGVKPGEGYDPEHISPGLKRLFETHQFRDVRAFREPGTSPDSVNVVVEVSEYPRVDGVRFDNNNHVGDDDLKKAVKVGKGTFVRPSLTAQDRDAIQEIYRDKGYYRAAVKDTVMQDRKTGQELLVYKVTEGNKVHVKHIDFIGNELLDSQQIRHAMKLRTDTWLRGGDFNPKTLQEDRERIIQLYKSEGYLDVNVNDPELDFSQDGKGLDIYITLVEGRQYFVGKVDWTGNTLFPDTTIAQRITLKKGQPFNDVALSMIQFNIANLYGDRGYIYATVTPVKKINGDVVDLTFEIEPGSLAHVHEINITGNTKTWEGVIRRQLTLYPGDVFASTRLRRSLREVFNLGFFAGPPEVSVNQVPGQEGDIDLSLKVTEKSAGQFRVGAGFSQLNRVSGFIGLTEPNFLGRAYRVGVNWEFSQTRQDVNLQFTDPWFAGTPTELGLQVYAANQDRVQQQFYSDRCTGFSVRVGRPFPLLDYTTISVRYSLEEVELSNFTDTYLGSLRYQQWPQTTSSVGLTLLRNSTDNPFHPSTGTRTTLNGRWVGSWLGGDVDLQSYQGEFSWFQTLAWKFVLELRQTLGIVDALKGTRDVPDYERFRLGGNRRYGLRGYDFYEVVPRGNDPFTGGRFFAITVAQIEFPLVAPTVYGHTFFDFGNTWNSFEGAELGDGYRGAGLGIVIELPMIGLLGFDYAYGFDRVGGGRWQPHITFGSGF